MKKRIFLLILLHQWLLSACYLKRNGLWDQSDKIIWIIQKYHILQILLCYNKVNFQIYINGFNHAKIDVWRLFSMIESKN